MAEGAYKTAGGVHNWSEFTVDEANGIAFIRSAPRASTSTAAIATGNNLFAQLLVAIDARTGKRLWHQQLVHHDLWDYDLPQAPKLLTIRQNGRAIDVVAQATKHGLPLRLRAQDRAVRSGRSRSGRCRSPTCPASSSSPTQPFPTKPAPFARQSFTEKDINPYLPKDEQERCAQRLRSSRNEGLVHAAELRGLDRDAGSQRRRELGQLGRRSDQRRVLCRREEHAA